MAPGRFAAAINQAPLRRRAQSRWLRPYDLMLNSTNTLFRVRAMPPDQLLRRAFERRGTSHRRNICSKPRRSRGR